MTPNPKPERPRDIANDILDAVETATRKWTRQKKSEERHPGMIRYRVSRMTNQPTMKQKAAWEKIAVEVYSLVSGPRNLPALARQMYYQARPKIMAMTEDKELQYGYFSQTLLPDYIEEHPERTKTWNVVYDARGHFEEPHTNRRIGCGTLEVRNYLRAVKKPTIVAAGFSDATIDIIGPSGGFSGVLFCEKEGFNPLFRAVKLANHYDLMIISNKGLSVTACRELIDSICGDSDIPLFVLHDFDFDGFKIFGTLQRDTRRYRFANAVEVIDLGLRLGDITGLEREPAAATKTSPPKLREQLTNNSATAAEIEILLHERVELNAMTSDALIAMIERKLRDYGLQKVIPDDDLLGKAYREFHRSQQLEDKFDEMKHAMKEARIKVPKDVKKRVRGILTWDDAVQIVLDETQLSEVRADKEKAKKKSGDFTEEV
jgi:hypothetical protein